MEVEVEVDLARNRRVDHAHDESQLGGQVDVVFFQGGVGGDATARKCERVAFPVALQIEFLGIGLGQLVVRLARFGN